MTGQSCKKAAAAKVFSNSCCNRCKGHLCWLQAEAAKLCVCVCVCHQIVLALQLHALLSIQFAVAVLLQETFLSAG